MLKKFEIIDISIASGVFKKYKTNQTIMCLVRRRVSFINVKQIISNRPSHCVLCC